MAMSAAVLGPALKAAVSAVALSPEATYRDRLFEAMANAIITHITSAAVVAVTVTSVTGVTAGAGVSGPGTGTGTIT